MQKKSIGCLLNKLSILGLYMLFLSVHLNLKYTLFNIPGINISVTAVNTLSDTKLYTCKVPGEGKVLLLKVALSKRYLPQDAYEVPSLPGQVAFCNAVAVKQITEPVQRIQRAEQLSSFLRGPPHFLPVS